MASLSFWERLAVALLVRSPRTSLLVVKERDTSIVFVSADKTDPLAAYVVSGLQEDEPASMILERLYHAPSYGEVE
ncbi:MAG: hypothetical protein EBY30_00150 [Rhodospirillales bacterium]|nr:hypothetical protein [Rhodospirillales bacterium]